MAVLRTLGPEGRRLVGNMPLLFTLGREGGRRTGSTMATPRVMPLSARRGGVEVFRQAIRPGRDGCAHAGAGGGTLDRQGAPAVAGSHTVGRGRSYLTVETPWPMPHGARRGRVEVTGQAVRPGRAWCVHAGVGGRTLDRQGAAVVAGLRTPWREVGRWIGSAPRSWPVCARRGGGGATWECRRPGRCHIAPAGAGWK